MVFLTRVSRILVFLIAMTMGYCFFGYCFSGSTDLEFVGEKDTKKYMGYSYKIKKTSDDFCIHSIDPNDGILTPGTGVVFDIDYKSGAFTSCGWRHSHQWFHVEKYDDPNISADIQWNKPAGKDPHINVEHDPHGIVHEVSRHFIKVGYPR